MFKESRMGIALFTFGRLLAPFRTWKAQPAPTLRTAPVHPTEVRPTRSRPGASCRESPRRPLRVVRVMEPSRAAAGAGRMFISGRMADVCAELDRLAALEAAAR
jgi:hypothetical protein